MDSPSGGQQGQGQSRGCRPWDGVGEELGEAPEENRVQGKQLQGPQIKGAEQGSCAERKGGCGERHWEQDAAAGWDLGFLFAPTLQQNFCQCSMRKRTSRDSECPVLTACCV